MQANGEGPGGFVAPSGEVPPAGRCGQAAVPGDAAPASGISAADMTDVFRAAAELVGHGIAILQDAVFAYVNPAFAELLGASPAEMIGTPCTDCVRPEDLSVLSDRYHRRIAGEEVTTSYEARLVRRDGETLHVHVNAHALTWDGRPAVLVVVTDLTPRREAEEQLRKAEQQQAAILDGISELVVCHDLENRIVWANRAAHESVKAPPGSLVGRRCYEVWEGRSTPCKGCPVQETLRTGERCVRETTATSCHTWPIAGYPVTDGAGKLVGAVEISVDVTERRRAEEALRESSEMLEALMRSSPVAIVILDREGRVRAWSRAAERMFGWTEQEAMGRVYPPAQEEEREDFQARLKSVFEGRAFGDAEVRRRRKDGSLIDVSLATAGLYDAHGSVVGAMGISTDITQRKRAEEALRESEKKYRLIAENAGDMISLHDREGVVWRYANPAALRTLGYAAEELIGTSALDLVHPDDAARAVQALDEGAVTGLAAAQLRVRKKDGTYVWVEAHGAHVEDEGGRPATLIISRDITEQRRAQERMATRAERLSRQLADRYDMVGASPAMQDLWEFIRKVAPTDAGVLICGESGTGKEMVARAIHQHSLRHDGPLEVVNCAAIQPTLLESELFGHARGAFTGAVADKPGRFELADGGTLFLDEVAELPLECQTKLLRALEEGQVRRVGATRDRPADVRVIAATNRDVDRALAEGRLRLDLFYRLNRMRVEVPPLRQRQGDIELLASHFLSQFSSSFRRGVTAFDPAVLDAFRAYGWPGNVRELRNVVERMVLMADGPVLCLEDVPADVRVSAPGPAGLETLEEMERRHVLAVLDAVDGNKRKAAQVLGIDRSTLYARLRAYGIAP